MELEAVLILEGDFGIRARSSTARDEVPHPLDGGLATKFNRQVSSGHRKPDGPERRDVDGHKSAPNRPTPAGGPILGSRGRAYGPTNPVWSLFRTDSPRFANETGLSALHRTARGLLHSRSAFGIGLPLTASDRRHLGCGCSSVVEHDLAKVGVEGSSPFARSNLSKSTQ